MRAHWQKTPLAKAHNEIIKRVRLATPPTSATTWTASTPRGTLIKNPIRQPKISFLGRIRAEIVQSTTQVPDGEGGFETVDVFTPLIVVSGPSNVLENKERILSNWKCKKLLRENGDVFQLIQAAPTDLEKFNHTFTSFEDYRPATFELKTSCFLDFNGQDKDGFEAKFVLPSYPTEEAAIASVEPVIPESTETIAQFDFIAETDTRKKWKPIIAHRYREGGQLKEDFYVTVPYFWNREWDSENRNDVWSGFIFTAPEIDVVGKRKKYHYGHKIEPDQTHFFLCAEFEVKFKISSIAYDNANPPTSFDDNCNPLPPDEWQLPVRRFYQFEPIGDIFDPDTNTSRPFYGAVKGRSFGDPLEESVPLMPTGIYNVARHLMTVPTVISTTWNNALTIDASDAETEGENITYGDPDDYYPGWDPGEEYPDPTTTTAPFLYKLVKTIRVPILEVHKYGKDWRVEGFAFNVNDVVDHRYEEPRCGRLFEKGKYPNEDPENPITWETAETITAGAVEQNANENFFASFRNAFPHLKIVPRFRTENCDKLRPDLGDTLTNSQQLQPTIPWWTGGYRIERAAPIGEWTAETKMLLHELQINEFTHQCTPVDDPNNQLTVTDILIQQMDDTTWRKDPNRPLDNSFPVSKLYLSPVDYLSNLYFTPTTGQIAAVDNYANPDHPMRPSECPPRTE